MNVLNVPDGSRAAVAVRGPDGIIDRFATSGSTCLQTPGTYWLHAQPVNFKTDQGQPWRAYPTGPGGAVAAEYRRFVVSSSPQVLPIVESVNYFDQAPLSTLVLTRSQVVVPTGRFLPAFGAVTLHLSMSPRLRPGDTVVAPVGPGLPHGLLGTIVSARSVGSTVALVTTATTPFRAFSRGVLHMHVVQSQATTATLGGLSAAAAKASPRDLSIGCGSLFSVTGSASFQPAASINLGWSWGPWYSPWQVEISGSFSLSPGVSGQLTVSDTSGVSCNVSEDLPPVTIGTVCTEIGCFTFNLVVTASVSGSVDQAFTQSLTESLGGSVGASFSFGYNGSGFQTSDTLQVTGESTSTSVWQGSVGVGIGPALQVLYGIPDVGGVGPQVGVQDTASFNGTATGWSLQGGIQASVGFALSALGFSYSNSIDIPVATQTLASGSWPTQPSPPRSVTASPDPSAPATSVDVSWLAPAWPGTCGLSGYNVTVGPASTTTGASATTATVTGLTGGTTYPVTVTATTSSCGTSQASTTITTPLAPPAAPTLDSVTTALGSGQPAGWATFTAPPACSGCSSVTGYQIAWSGDGTSGTVDVPGSPDAFALPAWGVPYSVTVAATSSQGTGPASNAVSFTPTGNPGAPTSVAVGAGLLSSSAYTGPAATLTWSPPDSDGGLPLTRYEISWTGGQFFQPVTAGTQAVIHLPTWGATYSFCVIAYNARGNGPPSPCVTATAIAPPGAPTGLQVSTSSGGTATLTWLAPPDYGSAISAYLVQWAASGVWQSQIAATTSATVTLSSPGTYFLTVLARNAAGDGPTSSSVCATSGTAAPCPPIITATSGGSITFLGSPSVTWSPPSQIGGSAIVSYTINWTGPSAGSISAGANATSASLPLTNAGTYTIVVRATNATGTSLASPSATLTVVPYRPPPP
ncbi:MAG: fibronectin type III domain-containing protein [Acidimicrobiales bacterium]